GSPFLLPGGPNFAWPLGRGRSPFDDLDDTPNVDTNSELSLPTAPDSQIFLHAIADKASAVVGEQITVSFYAYTRIDAQSVENHDAKMADFLRVPILKNPGADKAQIASAGGTRFAVRLLDRVALFPLKTGDLHTGSMSMRFSARRLGANALRESNDLVF